MELHRHEPVIGRTRSLHGQEADFLDADAYPLVSECQHCDRYIRCEVMNGRWRTTEEREGLEDWPAFHRSKQSEQPGSM